jgi:hypothetical protein
VASPDQFDYDLFISYAHVDDEPIIDGATGWVSALARGLRNVLARKLGQRDGCRIWFDTRIIRHEESRTVSLDTIARSKLLLAVVSPAYLASEWCAAELRAFASRHDARGRIIPVWLHPMPPEDLPDALRGLSGCKMWAQDDTAQVRIHGWPDARPEDREYWNALNVLADTVFAAMRDVQVQPATAKPPTADPPAADPPAERLSPASIAQTSPPKPATTARDVFISYSSKDKPIADATCAMLEQHGIRCWIAPRDILPGKTWAGSIIEAINVSRMMVLVFSGHCNTSPQIEREVERAINRGIPIIPMRIEDVQPTDSLSYYISTPHWLDAFSPPLEQHLRRLVEVVRTFIS